MSDISRSFVGQDKQLPTFFLDAGSIAVGNNKSMVSIVNESGSGKIVSIREIRITNSTITAVTGTVILFELRRITSHTGGTSLTPVSADTQDSLPSQVTNRTGSTVSGEDTVKLITWYISSDDWGAGTLDVEGMEAIIANRIANYVNDRSEQKAITLREGEGITLKCATNSTAGTFEIMIRYTVE